MTGSATQLLVEFGPWGVGWCTGWLLLWRTRPLPRVAADVDRPAVAVIVPARNEADALPALLPPLVAALRAQDELVVVDDHSTDGTGHVAAGLGARVVHPPELPAGWLGKPHACWHGALATTAPVLVFLDADVRPSGDLLDRLGAAVAARPEALVSVQPWHVVERPTEHLSLLCNVTALMGVGAFSILGDRVRPRAAFGPVIALHREAYDRVGGHADPVIRRMHTEDIGLARAVGAVRLHGGRPDIAFRMYPGGWSDLWRGWTRSLATGAGSAPWWAALGTLAWIWSLAAGWLVWPGLAVASAVQLWVLGRRAGRFSPWLAVLFPIALAAFLAVIVRSLWRLVWRRPVTWKDRAVPSR